MDGFDACFAELKDPRSAGSTRHDLLEILMIALCAVLSGGQSAVDMAVFAEAKQEFLGNFLELRNGIPSHDTFSRVFRRLDPDQFRACFQKFVARFGLDAMKFVNSPIGRQLHLRGVNAKVIQGAVIRIGDLVRKV